MLAAGLGGGALPAPTAAWTGGPCATNAGVTVVVDLTAFDAGVVIRCAPGTPSSGLDALVGTGHSVAQIATMPGFVCRIDGLPGPADESCATTPPATAYWSYWTANRGGSWTYSPVGASASRPKQGSVEGWAFTDGSEADPPSVAPPPLVAATPPPATAAPTPRPSPAPTPRPTAAATALAPSSVTPALEDQPGATQTAKPAVTPIPATSAAEATQDERPTPAPSSTHRASPQPLATTAPSGGSGPVGTVVGIGLIVAVGGAAVATQRRLVVRDG